MITSGTEPKNVILPYGKTEDIYIEDLGKLPAKPFYSAVKWIFDKLFALVALILLLIPMMIIAIAIKIDNHGPAFFTQERLGLNGKKYQIIKFRTMFLDAEKNGAQWSLREDDERVTRVGRFLRKTRLDELPQFLNVLQGNMSVVGPRPEREIFYKEFETYIHGFSQRLKVKPGIAGYAQVYGGFLLEPEKKILYDVEYIKHRSLWFDFKIILKTLFAICKNE